VCRKEGADILIAARTDARQAVSLEEALWRAQAFAEAGADILFIDALGSVEEMQAFCNLGGAAKGVPKVSGSQLEGGGGLGSGVAVCQETSCACCMCQ
jgi:hypothetical protein